MARGDFVSDNVAGAMPEVIEALSRFNGGSASSYGKDEVSARAADLIRALLDVDAEVVFVASGTAANALTLGALVQPHEAFLAHEHSHVATDETGAPAFFGGGMGVIPLQGSSGRIDPAALQDALDAPDHAHRQGPAALSLTNATEYGAVYSRVAFSDLVGRARTADLKIQLDGARLANAVAGGLDPKDIVGRPPLDVVVLGGTKAGSTPTEAVVIVDKSLARRLGARLKHAGQLVSKTRFLAAPWIGMLEDGAWCRRAAHANAMATRLAALSPFAVAHPVEANGVFLKMDDAAYVRFRNSGWSANRVLDGSIRFMCSWSTTTEAVEELAVALRAVA